MTNLVSELERLAELFEKGVLTKEEYNIAKSKILRIDTPTNESNTNSTTAIQATSKTTKADIDYLDAILNLAKNGYAFQSKLVMDKICKNEIEKIKSEKQMWRLGGAIVGGLIGLGDGFDLTDILFGAAVSQIGATAHGVASDEQIKFLEKVKADWLVTANSPHEIKSRLGAASCRAIWIDTQSNNHTVFNYHRGNRGEYLIPLGFAGQVAKGFLSESTREVLSTNFDQDNYETISHQLYPCPENHVLLKSFRKISEEEAANYNDEKSISIMASFGFGPVLIEAHDSKEPGLLYKVPIPVHSDF